MENKRFGDAAIRSVKWHLAHYFDIKRAIKVRRIELKRHKQKPERVAEGFVSNPTAREVEIDMTRLEQVYLCDGRIKVDRPEEWVDAIEHVFNKLDAEDRNLVYTAFWSDKSWRTAIIDLHMDKTTFYKRRDRIVYLCAAHCAVVGLVKI